MQQTHLDKVLGSLAADDEIGTVDRPRSWFKGELAMKSGAFQDYAADLVLFSGASDRTQVYLLGSIYSLVGRAEDKDSIDYYTLRYFEAITGEHQRRYVRGDGVRGIDSIISTEIELDEERGKILSNTVAISKTVSKMTIPARRVEFVAKKIAIDPTGLKTVIVGSPLYVYLSE
jgi:hypothetical protein